MAIRSLEESWSKEHLRRSLKSESCSRRSKAPARPSMDSAKKPDSCLTQASPPTSSSTRSMCSGRRRIKKGEFARSNPVVATSLPTGHQLNPRLSPILSQRLSLNRLPIRYRAKRPHRTSHLSSPIAYRRSRVCGTPSSIKIQSSRATLRALRTNHRAAQASRSGGKMNCEFSKAQRA